MGADISVPLKEKGYKKYLLGGTLFGLGWALVGVCPGPMYILLGTGVFSMLVVIIAAFLGAMLYGALRNKLPH